MKYNFYFVNNSRVINEWHGYFPNKEAAEYFATGAAISAMTTSGEIGIFARLDGDPDWQYSGDGFNTISRQMTEKRRCVLLAYLGK